MKKIGLFFISICIISKAYTQEVIYYTRDSIQLTEMQIQDVLVTAEKRENKVHDLPFSISAISTIQIEQNETKSLTGLTAKIPNYFMPDYGTKLTSPVYIRGIGSRINSPSVGLYVDDVPYFEKGAFDFDFYDIQRIEVLRGPQGTLYGRNSMGGIIKVYTREIKDYRKTAVSTDIGNYGMFQTHISHNQPVNDKVGLLLNANYLKHEGYHNNEFNNKPADAMDSYSARLKFDYQASDKLNIRVMLSGEKSNQTGYPYAEFVDTTNHLKAVNYNRNSLYKRDLYAGSLSFKYKTPAFVLKSMSSYQFIDDRQEIDQDFTPAQLFFVTQDQLQNMLAQEISIISQTGGNYKWTFGAFGFYQLFDKGVDVFYGEDAQAAYHVPPDAQRIKKYENTMAGAAVFHQSSYNFKNLALTAGIRLDYELAVLDYNYDFVAGGEKNTLSEFQSDLDNLTVLPKFAIRYTINNKINVYSTIARGYKGGGFNSTFEREQDRAFEPEYSLINELGFKSKWLADKIIANFCLFYIDWQNQQVYQPVPSGQGSMLKNAGHSISKGAELELMAKPFKNFIINFNYGYTHAKFKKYQRDNETDYSGNFIPYVPRNTYNCGISYRIPLKKSFLQSIYMHSNFNRIGKLYWTQDNKHFQSPYYLLNTKMSFITKHIDLAFWAKNILKSNYQSFFFPALGNYYAQPAKPLRFGISLTARI